MLKNFYLFVILMTFFSLNVSSEILTVNSMDEVSPYFDSDDALGVFDVDMVLVQPANPIFQMKAMQRHKEIYKKVMLSLTPEQQTVLRTLITVTQGAVLVDAATPAFLETLNLRNIPTMALTANLTGKFGSIPNMELWNVERLQALGIDFSRCAPYPDAIVFKDLPGFRGTYSTYTHGMLFVNGMRSNKGKAFVKFLERSGNHPHKVIFIDDRLENVEELGAALQEYDPSLEFVGLHFLGALNCPASEINATEFEAAWFALAEQAKQMCPS